MTYSTSTLGDSVAEFLSSLVIEATQSAYRTALNSLLSDLRSVQKVDPQLTSADQLTVAHLTGWLDSLVAANRLSRRTIQTYAAGALAYVNYLSRQGLTKLSLDELETLRAYGNRSSRSHAESVLSVSIVSLAQIEMLISAAKTMCIERESERMKLSQLRNVAIVETLRCTGLRVNELVALQIRSIQQDRTLLVRNHRKERTARLDHPAWSALQAYLAARHQSDSNTNQPAEGIPLFARHDKRSARQLLPLSTEAIERIFRELADMAGLSGAAITPDAVRQLAPISGYAATRQLEQIQQALHHAIPGQGSLYTRAAE